MSTHVAGEILVLDAVCVSPAPARTSTERALLLSELRRRSERVLIRAAVGCWPGSELDDLRDLLRDVLALADEEDRETLLSAGDLRGRRLQRDHARLRAGAEALGRYADARSSSSLRQLVTTVRDLTGQLTRHLVAEDDALRAERTIALPASRSADATSG